MPILLVLGFLLMILVFLAKGWFVAFWIVFGLLCVVIAGFVFLLCATVLSGGKTSAPPPPPAKNRNQTEDEFNEMAMTNLYANQYLDEDK